MIDKKFIIIAILLTSVLFCSCKATPTKSDIYKQDGKSLTDNSIASLAILEETQKKDSGDSSLSLIDNNGDGMPIIWKDEFFRSDVLFNFDVKIEIPEISDLKILSVVPDPFLETEISIFVDEFFPNSLIYKEALINAVATKDVIAEQILRTKQAIAEAKNNISEDQLDEYIARQKKDLSDLEIAYASAPETIINMPIEIDNASVAHGGLFTFRDNENDSLLGRMSLSGSAMENGMLSRVQFFFGEHHSNAQTDQSNDQKMARQIADEVIKNISADELVFCDVYIDDMSDPPIYEFDYVKTYYDLPEVSHYRLPDLFSDEPFDLLWESEVITIQISNNNVFGIFWRSPTKIETKASQTLSLVNFEEIQEIFKNQIQVNEVWIENNNYIESSKIHINNISLNVMKVKMKNGGYEMHPVWDFLGTRIDKYSEVEPGGWLLDENMEHQKDNVCFMTIDAVNGDIIDRNRGY